MSTLCGFKSGDDPWRRILLEIFLCERLLIRISHAAKNVPKATTPDALLFRVRRHENPSSKCGA
jgi:hypothetical protein